MGAKKRFTGGFFENNWTYDNMRYFLKVETTNCNRRSWRKSQTRIARTCRFAAERPTKYFSKNEQLTRCHVLSLAPT